MKTLRYDIWEMDSPFIVNARNMKTAVLNLINETQHPILQITISDPALKAERKRRLKAKHLEERGKA
ncbi:MAG: hypothetical protein J0L53_18805 [Spirochaetes bacterium]|nr:hypothetical protein [Spirochaetota bacterium]